MPHERGTQISESAGEVVVYATPDGGAQVVVDGDETVWLTQAHMVELLGRGQSAIVISRHVGNVFEEGELPREGSMQILHIASDGDRPTTFYNLNVSIPPSVLTAMRIG